MCADLSDTAKQAQAPCMRSRGPQPLATLGCVTATLFDGSGHAHLSSLLLPGMSEPLAILDSTLLAGCVEGLEL